MGNLKLASASFVNGGEIPRKHGYKHGNINPNLKILDVPSSTQSLVLIMDDPDAQAAVGKIWVHWVIWNIEPSFIEIKEGSIPASAIKGRNDFGELGYGGPAPPDKRHTYIFKLYAVDTKLDLNSGSTKNQVEEAIKDHILDQTTLEGTFAP